MKKARIKLRKPGKPISASTSRYKFVPGMSDKVKEQSKKTYRQKVAKNFELEGSVILRALSFLDGEAITLPVINQITARKENHPVLRLIHAAKLLNVSYQTLWRWTSETQQLPMPVLTDTQGREYAVYHVEEVRIMLRTIGAHLNQFAYYRKDHDATKNKLFAEIDALRANNFTVKGTTNARKKIRPHTSKKIRTRKRNA